MCLYMYPPLSFLGNGSVNTFSLLRIQATIEELWTRRFLRGPYYIKGESVGLSVYPLLLPCNGSVNTFPRQRRNVAGVVF
jgi:hypothetical protein